jgi:uncharacterized membrane protein YdjX (TVP38/TMEM64 family)
LQGTFRNATASIDAYIQQQPVAGALFFVGLAAVSAILSPFSSLPMVPFAVAIWGPEKTMALLLSGWMAGAVAAYAIGRYAGFPLLRRFKVYRKIREYKRKIPEQKQFLYILLLRTALPSELLSYALGVVKYRFIPYITVTLIAEIPFALISVYSSEAFIEANRGRFVMVLSLGVVLFFVAFKIFKARAKT